jgi:hypothetical protein
MVALVWLNVTAHRDRPRRHQNVAPPNLPYGWLDDGLGQNPKTQQPSSERASGIGCGAPRSHQLSF